VYGENGSIDWRQEDPNRLRVKWLDGPEEIRHAAGSYLSADAREVTRLPGGHPEGYIEAFAVLYREFADGLLAWRAGEPNPLPATLPGIVAGVRGMPVSYTHLLGQCFGGGQVDVGDPDECAGANQFLGSGLADAAGAAGDQGVPTVEAKGLVLVRGRFKRGSSRIVHGSTFGRMSGQGKYCLLYTSRCV